MNACHFDAVIVGAGPAGSTVATLLARAGWRVAIVEKQAFPRRKVCGECIAASNLALLTHLGIGDAFDASAGPELRRVTLMQGDGAVTANLPAASDARFAWGRALGRETLDGLLLGQARAAGAQVFQPCAVQAITGSAGAWTCEVRSSKSQALSRLHAAVMIDAHGSWEDLPSERPKRRLTRGASDLFAFKANFTGAAMDAGAIGVLALDGGYGGMVLADGGMTTIACCIRRDRLSQLRSASPGQRASDVVEAWLKLECKAVRNALHSAQRDGAWLSSGPLNPGVRIDANDAFFRVGNAAGEAHPILGEGMSMALQSGALLSAHLLRRADVGRRLGLNELGCELNKNRSAAVAIPDAALQAQIQRQYAKSWAAEFVPRLRVAAVFAHLAMRPIAASALLKSAQAWPGLLTHGARWGGKVRIAARPPAAAQGVVANASLESQFAKNHLTGEIT